MMQHLPISDSILQQRRFFASGRTLDVSFRKKMLRRLYVYIREHQEEIAEALRRDLGKGGGESYMTETGMALSGISFLLGHLGRLTRKKRARGSAATIFSRGCILPEPYGAVLVMAPWNYPFLLCADPLAAAVAAGNCVVLKPSELAPATADVVEKMVEEVFPPELVCVVKGGKEIGEELLKERYDYIFYTGGTRVGRIVMRQAAEHLTPLTLELGGKSPCIIGADADLERSLKRILSGKLLNAGQTCVAPDYLLVHRSFREKLVPLFRRTVSALAGESPCVAADYPSIVTEAHFERLKKLMEVSQILAGGDTDAGRRKIAPCLIEAGDLKAPVMQEEIFGPLLPVLWFDDLEEAAAIVEAQERPLALYLFMRDRRKAEQLLRRLHFGGGCVNDTVLHLANPHLPFGGVGKSGMGAYHGKAGFDTFTHYKSVLYSSAFENPLRYPPFTGWKIRLLRRFLK